MIGRLPDHIALEQLQAEAEVVYRQLSESVVRPDSILQVSSASRGLGDALARQYWPSLRLLMVGVALLLVMACVNVAGLLLARTGHRQDELAVRRALGSGRSRLIRQCLVEGVLLAGVGSLLGLALALAGARALLAIAVPSGTPVLDLSLDANVLLFTIGVSMLSTLLFGLVPAVLSSRAQIESALRSRSRAVTGSRSLMNRILVASQVALAVVLVAGAVHFARSLYGLYGVDPGFDRRQLIIATVDGRPAGFQTPQQFSALAQQIVERLSALPGVRSTIGNGDQRRAPSVGRGEATSWTRRSRRTSWRRG